MLRLFSIEQMLGHDGTQRLGAADQWAVLRVTGDTVEPVTLTEVPRAELLEVVVPEFITTRMAREERQFSNH